MSTQAMLTGMVEAALYVSDLDRSVAFYEDVFGFGTEIRDAQICVLNVASQSALILLPIWIKDQPDRIGTADVPFEGNIPSSGAEGRMHVALKIPKSELPKWEQRLADKNIEIVGRTKWARGGESIYFRDPDAHLVELLTPGLWSFY
ncbi:MAG: VOC family protein [Gemmatimonadaceae bacterium]|nr:VOC family protein [Acetobacteraceae bacterium]